MATRTITRYRTRTVRGKRRSKAGFRLPLAVIAGFLPVGLYALEAAKVGDFEMAGKRLAVRLTGYNAWDNQWYWREVVAGWTPIIAGVLMHKVANKLGINRAISKAGIPWVSI